MLTSRRVFVVVASIAGLVAGTAFAEAPKLQYQFQPDRQYGHDITIKVETDEYTETYTGYSLRRLLSVQDDRFTLHYQGFLDPHIEWKPGTGLTMYGPTTVNSNMREMVIDSRGKLLSKSSMLSGLSPLPYVLGFLETITLEHLPAEPRNQWQWKEDFEMVESSHYKAGFTWSSPTRKATRQIDYSIAEVQGDLVRIDKTYLMRTGEGLPSVSRVRMDGTGTVVFDRRAGVVSSIDMKYSLLIKNDDGSQTITADVNCRLMNPTRLKQFLTDQDNKWKQHTGEDHAEAPKTPLGPTERTKLLRSLRSRDRKVVEAAVERLIWAPADDRPADFAVPLAKILQGRNDFPQTKSDLAIDRFAKTLQDRGLNKVLQGRDPAIFLGRDYYLRAKAVRALVVWATPEAEAALAEAIKDMSFNPNMRADAGRPIFSPALEALVTIGTESAARAVAQQILDPSREPVEVLKRMGPAAELPMIELILDETGGNAKPRLACEVLAEIGGLRSVSALQRTTQGWRAQSHAQEALEAIAKRQGLSVEELLTKAQSMAPATVANPIAASSSGFRIWSDATGRFEVEAQMVSAADGTVNLKKRDGERIGVPLDRLSQADHDYVNANRIDGPSPKPSLKPSLKPSPKPKASPEAGPFRISRPISRPTGEARDTELLGGSGGFEFRFVDRTQTPLLGIRFRIGAWEGERAVALTQALFNRQMAKFPGTLIAKQGYAVGGMNVDSQTYVNALEIIFMRLKPDGSLDASDSYTSPWIGVRSGGSPKKLGGSGATVIGLYGRRGIILDAVGLVVCED